MCTLTSKEWSIFRGHTSVFHPPPPPLKVKQPFEFGIHTCYSLTFNWKNCCLKCQVLYSKNIPFEIFCVFCSRSSKATFPFPLLLYFQSRKCSPNLEGKVVHDTYSWPWLYSLCVIFLILVSLFSPLLCIQLVARLPQRLK